MRTALSILHMEVEEVYCKMLALLQLMAVAIGLAQTGYRALQLGHRCDTPVSDQAMLETTSSAS